jgi:hypothetical protein
LIWLDFAERPEKCTVSVIFIVINEQIRQFCGWLIIPPEMAMWLDLEDLDLSGQSMQMISDWRVFPGNKTSLFC